MDKMTRCGTCLVSTAQRLLKVMDKDEPAFIEPPLTVDYVSTLSAEQ